MLTILPTVRLKLLNRKSVCQVMTIECSACLDILGTVGFGMFCLGLFPSMLSGHSFKYGIFYISEREHSEQRLDLKSPVPCCPKINKFL